MKIGIVFGTFAPMHRGHMDVIETARRENENVCVICCGHDGDRGYPLFPIEKRYEYATEALSADDIKVEILYDTDPEVKKNWSVWQIWDYWTQRVRLMLFEKADIGPYDKLTWYTSEPDYADYIRHAGQNVHLCGRDRPVSGTMIRNNPKGHWDDIVPQFRKAYESM